MDKKNLKILIVEDEAINFLYLQRILSNKNRIILHSKNGKEAIENIKKFDDIDCVLLDIKLPDKNGLDVAKEIKKIRKDVPIIIQTAYNENDKEFTSNRYIDDFISKPILREQLNKIIDKFTK